MKQFNTSGKTHNELLHIFIGKSACDIRFDNFTRFMYSTDASNYQVQPLGVAFPRDENELFEVVNVALENGIPILPRGSGTSMCGQAIGKALIIDFPRYMKRIHHINMDDRTAILDPGVFCASLNSLVEPYGFMFGPDPESADRATIGGMIGNNAASAHSVCYGMTADHIIGADAILSDGSSASFNLLIKTQAELKKMKNL